MSEPGPFQGIAYSGEDSPKANPTMVGIDRPGSHVDLHNPIDLTMLHDLRKRAVDLHYSGMADPLCTVPAVALARMLNEIDLHRATARMEAETSESVSRLVAERERARDAEMQKLRAEVRSARASRDRFATAFAALRKVIELHDRNSQ